MAENSFADGVVAGMATNDRGGYGYGFAPVMPMYGYGGGFGANGFGYGGDWIWIILLFALFGNGGFGFGGGFGGGLGYDFPWLLNGQNGINNNVSNGFRDNAISSKLDSIQETLCNNATNSLQTAYENQINTLNQSFAMQQAFNNCCCENKLGIADLKYTVATENCADRQALNNGVRDIIASQTAGIQTILDRLAQDKVDEKNDTIAQLRQELLYARGQASQVAQNSAIINGVYNRLNECPVGTVPVYGEQPIFRCPNNNSCNCGNANI